MTGSSLWLADTICSMTLQDVYNTALRLAENLK
jgi:hypothetical protein